MPPRSRRFFTHLLRVVSLPHWLEHWSRSVLTVLGVSLGVATIIAVGDVSESVLASFHQMVRTVSGASELEIRSATGSVDEDLIRRAASVEGVHTAAGLVESFVTLAEQPDESLYVLGVDFLGSPIWEGQLPRSAIEIPDEILFLNHADSVALSRQFGERLGLLEGQPLRVVSPLGPRTLTIRGFLGDIAPARLFDGAIAIMDLPAAQELLDRRGRVDRIAVQVISGAPVADVRVRLAASLGPTVEVGPPETRGDQIGQLLFSLQSMLLVAGSLAVIVGAFIVYQAVAISVQQRRREFALLNVVGVSLRTLWRLCLVETLFLALLGVILGTLGGRAFGLLASGMVGQAASEIWVHVDVRQQTYSTWGVVAGAVIGIGMATVAAYFAIRATFAAPTMEALRPVSLEIEATHRDERRLLALAVVLIAATWLVSCVSSQFGYLVVGVIILSQVSAYCGGALLSPSVVMAVGSVLRSWGRRSPQVALRLAVDSLPRNPRRSGLTVATITAALGMVVSLAGLVRSFETAWLGWMENHFAADLFVGSGARFHLLAGPPMGPEVAARLRRISGIASVEPFRVLQIAIDARPVFLEGISIDDRLAHGGLDMVEGTLADAAHQLQTGTGVLLSDNLAFRLGLHRGDEISLPTPTGSRTFHIEGTFVDYLGSLDLGAVAVASNQLGDVWGDRSANLLRLWLIPGMDLSQTRRTVLKALGGGGYYAITAHQFLDAARDTINRFFIATWILDLVAVVVGIIGVINAQLAAVMDRSREIVMLRTVGVSARQITRALVLECGTLGVLGGLLGLALGSMLSAQFVLVSMRLLTGWRLPFHLPVLPLCGAVLGAGLISAIAGWVPARAAARLDTSHHSLD